MTTSTILILIWLITPIPISILAIYFFLSNRKYRERTSALETRFSSITIAEDELAKVRQQTTETTKKLHDLKGKYTEKRQILKRLEAEVAIFDEKIAFAELGIYEPHFDFNDSEKYKQNIQRIRQKQKDMASRKIATHCPSNWTVDGSVAKGNTMVGRQNRLTMRAFNNECEAAIANTRWNNVIAMEKRILNAAKQIDSTNKSMNLTISTDYIDLKLSELYLTHEHREQLKIEKEERAELARAEREEKRLLTEAKKAEREKFKYEKLLEKARREVNVDTKKIAELETALALATQDNERVKAMAEITKCGYVYIISNVGSFGDDVVKIGLTRRLNPDDRVRELGDASVPFLFDTHAIIYSDSAPELEAALHKRFEKSRVNTSNFRKEFFRAKIEDIDDAVKELAPDASFFKDRDAQEWHETMSRRNAHLGKAALISNQFPAEI